MSTPEWPAERLAKLQAYLALGDACPSYKDIGKEMGLTVGAVAGKVSRMGGSPFSKEEIIRRRTHGGHQRTSSPRRRARSAALTPASTDKQCTIIDLEAGMCRAVVKEMIGTDTVYCGAQVKRGSYCAHHDAWFHQSTRPKNLQYEEPGLLHD